MAIPEIKIKLGADTSGLDQGLTKAQDAVSKFANAAEATGSGVGGVFQKTGDTIRDSMRNAGSMAVNALTSMISPASLVTAGVAAIGAVAAQAFAKMREETLSTDEVIKRHDGLVRALKSAYGEAASGLDDYSKKAEKVYQTQILADQQRLLQALAAETEKFLASVSSTMPALDEMTMRFGNVNAAGLTTKRGFEEFTGALTELQNNFRNGNITVTEFRDGVDAIAMKLKADGSPTAIKYGDELLEASKKMAELASKAGFTGTAIDLLSGKMQEGQAAAKQYADAMKTLQGIAAPKMTDRQKADSAYLDALIAARGDEDKMRQAAKDFEETKARIFADEAAKAKEAKPVDTTDWEAEAEKQRIQSRLEIIRQGLMSREQLEAEARARDEALVNEAFQKKIVSEQEKNALLEQMKADHLGRMEAMEAAAQQRGVDLVMKGGKALATAFEGNSKKMAGVAKTFAGVESLINAFRAFNQVLADPTLPWYAKIGAAASILAAGMQTVNAIRSISTSGGGGGGRGGGGAGAVASGGAGGASQQPEQAGRSMYVTLNGDVFNREMVRGLLEQVSAFQKDGGGKVVFG